MAAIINHLLWSEDFSSYGSDAAVKTAYPGEDGFNDRTYDENSADWGASAGPDGQAGIADSVVHTHDTGAIARHDLAPTCFGFRLKGRFNFAVPNVVLTGHYIFNSNWVTEDDAAGPIVQVSRFHSTSALTTFVRTISPYGNAGGGTAYTNTFAGALPANTPVTVEVYGRRSTILETSPGVFAPSTDGEVHFLVGGVEVDSFTGPVWNGRSDINPTPYWNSADYHTLGALSDIEVWDEVGCDGTSNPPFCPCEPTPPNPPPQPPPTPPNPPPQEPHIGEQLACLGGGLVPIQADFPPQELWWGL